MAGRVTQLPVEVVVAPTSASGRVTQLAIEVVIANIPRGTFTIDSILVGEYTVQYGDFPASAIVQSSPESSFSANAVIETVPTGSMTLGAWIAGSFGVDANVFATVERQFFVEAELALTKYGTFTSDALVLASFSQSFKADADISGANEKRGTLTLDAYVRPTTLRVSQSGFEVAYEKPRTFSVDARLAIVTTVAGSFTAGAYIHWQFVVDAWFWTGDANLQFSQFGLEVASERSPTFVLDSSIYYPQRPGSPFALDAWIRQGFVVDAEIWARHFWVYGWISGGRPGTWVSQAGYEQARTGIPNLEVAQAGLEVARSGSLIVWASQSGYEVAYEKPKGTISFDSSFYRPGEMMTPATFTVDAGDFVHTDYLDAVVFGPIFSSFTLAAAIVRKIEGDFVLGADICLGMKVDAIIGQRQVAIFTVFAYKVVRTTPTGTMTLDACTSAPFTVSAWLTKPIPFTVGASIIEEGKYLKSFPSDAVVSLPSISGEFLLEADISTLRTVVYEGDGSTRVVRNLITERLDFPGFPNPIVPKGNLVPNNCNNLYGPFYPIDMTPVRITLWDFPDYGTRTLGIHSDTENMWVWPDEPGVYEIWPSYDFEPHYVYTWTEGTTFDPTLSGSGMVSYYRDDTIVDALPAPTLDAWLVGTVGNPWAIDAEIVGREKTGSTFIDADLMKAGEQRGTFGVEAHLLAPRPFLFMVFAEVAALHFAVDALVSRPSFTLDAHVHLVGGADGVFPADAVVKGTVVPVNSVTGKGPTIDAVVVRSTKSSSGTIDADIVEEGERRGLVALDAILLGGVAARRFYLAALVIGDDDFTLDAYIAHRATIDAYIQPSFTVGAYVRGSSVIIFSYGVGTVIVTSGGSGYVTAPAVSFEGGGGSGAVAYAVVEEGVVTAIVVTDPGYGYTTAPTVVIDGAATAYAILDITRTDPYGNDPQIGRSFRVKIEAFIPDPIPIGNDDEIERLILLIMEAEAELEAMYCAVTHYSSQGATTTSTSGDRRGNPNPAGTGYKKSSSLPDAISQIGYPGAGDIDDCWVVATVWAANAAGWTYQPTVPVFRRYAGNPDRPGATGGTLDHVMRGARGSWPNARIRRYASSDWNGFISLLKAGWTASLAVRSSGLPSSYRYGFNGLHQVGVAYQNGSYFIMNPLQHNGSRPRAISGSDLRTAARGFTGGTICACMFD